MSGTSRFAWLIGKILGNEAATEEMRAAAKTSGRHYAVLTPTVPFSVQSNAGWFGGAPHLPADLPWPSKDGHPLIFLCQINLASLPKLIWSGIGPRTGWLAVFMPANDITPTILHVDGPLFKRAGPLHTAAEWFWTSGIHRKPLVQDIAPEFPLLITEHTGEPPLPMGYKRGKAPGFPDPRETELINLSDASIHPFNEVTLLAFIDSLKKDFDRTLRDFRNFESVKARNNDKLILQAVQAELQDAASRLAALTADLLPLTKDFNAERIQEILPRIAELPTFATPMPRYDDEGYLILNYTKRHLCERPDPGQIWWWRFYAPALDGHALTAYMKNPDSLPAALRVRLEKIWQFDASYEQAAMGHAPQGHLYTPHGPKTPNEVLLELPSSCLVGWKWGGLYSIAFFILREHLAKWNFANIHAEITN